MQNINKTFLAILLLIQVPFSNANPPDLAFLLRISHSVAKVHAFNADNQLGVGSSVVIAKNQVATNCHVIANARGIAINKLGKSYAPIAIKADWQHDLCILEFKHLPLDPLKLGTIDPQDYEKPIIAIGFSGSSPRPTRSFGYIKAFIPFDHQHLLQTSSGFSMGASGGALVNYEGELLGITTFKSPGKHGQYYSLPVDWIKALQMTTVSAKPSDASTPFWDVPPAQRPFFMQTVTPNNNKDWTALRSIAKMWAKQEPDNPEAWFYLAEALKGLQQLSPAKLAYEKALSYAPKHSRSLMGLSEIAIAQKNEMNNKQYMKVLQEINPALAECVVKKVRSCS